MTVRRDGKRYVAWLGWRDWRDPPGSRMRFLYRWVDAAGNPCDPPVAQKGALQRIEPEKAPEAIPIPDRAHSPGPAGQGDLF